MAGFLEAYGQILVVESGPTDAGASANRPAAAILFRLGAAQCQLVEGRLRREEIGDMMGRLDGNKEILAYLQSSNYGYGIAISGGLCTSSNGQDSPIYISDVVPGGPAENKLM